MDGILNVYKESGWTSFDVVAKLRGILKERKIGHTGTLDPAAEGVLPVCIGKATKVCSLLTDTGKTYSAVLLLGKRTDTEDLTGKVLQESPVTCSEEDLRRAAGSFIGEQQQIPPMYSARKVNGKRLYELARKGMEAERRPRAVTIEEIRFERIELPEAEMTVRCSKGTYIRTLCSDIGDALGCGGCMKQLLRTRVGTFSIEESHRLNEIEALCKEGRIQEILQPTDSVFPQMSSFTLTSEAEKLVRNGNPLSEAVMLRCSHRAEPGQEKDHVRLYAADGTFLAVYAYTPEKKSWRAEKMFL